MIRTPGEEARRVAHAIVCERQGSEWCHWSSNKDSHAHYCDTLTAAIQPYLEDIATLRADMNVIMEDCANLNEALEVAREGVTNIRNTPCKCWSGLQTTADVVLQGIAALVGQPGRTE